VTSAGVVLAATFAVFAVVGSQGAGGGQIRDMGVGLTLGILMDTFVVRTILVPCTCVLLGRWNWWPSKLTTDSSDSGLVSASADALGLVSPESSPDKNAGVSPSVAPERKHSLD
jgi:RND superfamily putative drug exporter